MQHNYDKNCNNVKIKSVQIFKKHIKKHKSTTVVIQKKSKTKAELVEDFWKKLKISQIEFGQMTFKLGPGKPFLVTMVNNRK